MLMCSSESLQSDFFVNVSCVRGGREAGNKAFMPSCPQHVRNPQEFQRENSKIDAQKSGGTFHLPTVPFSIMAAAPVLCWHQTWIYLEKNLSLQRSDFLYSLFVCTLYVRCVKSSTSNRGRFVCVWWRWGELQPGNNSIQFHLICKDQ